MHEGGVVGSREISAEDPVVAARAIVPHHSTPVEALARATTVRLVAPPAMESRAVAAHFAVQELVRRLVEVHGG